MFSRNKPLISLLVPLGGMDSTRQIAWDWLRQYWQDQLPGCEIVIGRDAQSRGKDPRPFSKTAAFNDAYNKSHGDVLVLLDADAYLDAQVVAHCVDRITLRPQSWRPAVVYPVFVPLPADCKSNLAAHTY